ncbi:substrate-binding domain-containing protein [Chamaesiphon sp. GL140_3_metabinner_50]|uniref:substrate-binding domain-containing protein n=1 Tax=Chamaesiphon sp. GL140_3_metabinner_50 TaxID=2970812 RepID=UPI0025E6FA96|nr:substrate-binding domain-containing protein [Chamaesiphon sp. GL140_3_metabinner_50]
MTAKKGPPPIVYIAGALALSGLGYAAYNKLSSSSPPIVSSPNNPSSPTNPASQTPTVAFNVPTAVAAGTVVKIGGATSMVQFNKALKMGFEQKFPGVRAQTIASSSSKGLADLAAGTIDITGISRGLTAAEQAQGLVAVPIAQDKIAIVVGQDSALSGGLTSEQVTKIFTGELKNWSEVGGKAVPIRPILRPIVSGTHQSFQEIGLQNKGFGSGGNFKVLERDASTPLFQALGTDGISYATFAQAANQSTVRSIAIDGSSPDAANYPYKRTLAYAYKGQPNDAVKAFLGFATSSEGQQLVTQQSQSK